TVAKFGGIIDRYTIDQAVEDGAVVPLLYEGRHVPLDIDEQPIGRWFEKYTAALTPEQKADLKQKYSTADQLNRIEQKIRAIAWDVSVHFKTNFQGTPFKGQLVTPSKADALLYKRFLDEFGMVTSEVLISAPDTREGHTDVDEVDDTANRPSVLAFWERTMKRFGSEERSEEHTSELQSRENLVCRLLLEKKKIAEAQEKLKDEDGNGARAT